MVKKLLKTLLIIIAVIAALIFGASFYVNKMVEDALHDQLKSVITANGLEEYVSYDEIDVQVLTGEIALKKLSIADAAGSIDIRAYEVFVKVSPAEAVGLARDPEIALLTKASAGATELKLSSKDGDDAVEIARLDLMLEGRVNQKLLENNEAVINDIDINLKNTGIDFPELGIYAGVKEFSGSFSGTMNPALLKISLPAFLGQNNKLRIFLGNADIELAETLRSETALFLGAASADQIFDTMHIEKISLDINSEMNKIDVDKLYLDTDVFVAGGTAEIFTGYGPAGATLEAELQIQHIADAARNLIEAYFIGAGLVIPEELPFTLNTSIAKDGSVLLNVE